MPNALICSGVAPVADHKCSLVNRQRESDKSRTRKLEKIECQKLKISALDERLQKIGLDELSRDLNKTSRSETLALDKRQQKTGTSQVEARNWP